MHLARAFAEAGHDVECPRLSGHGTRWQDIVGVRAEDWLEDLRVPLERLKARCDRVFLAGLSMGGTLTLRLAQQDPSIRGLMLFNHALVFGCPLVPRATPLHGPVHSPRAIPSDIKDPQVREPAYDRTPTAGVAQLHRLARAARRDLPSLAVPLLIFKSREDHVLPVRNATLTHREAGSRDKEVVWLENSYHVATMDFDKELIARRCLAFVARLAEGLQGSLPPLPIGGQASPAKAQMDDT